MAMGVALIGGLIFLFALAYQKTAQKKGPECVTGEKVIAIGEAVDEIEPMGDDLLVVTESGKALVVDGCTGELLRSWVFE